MNISDYSVEGLEEVWDYVDSFFNWDKTELDETDLGNNKKLQHEEVKIEKENNKGSSVIT